MKTHFADLLALVNHFDAVTTICPYREALSVDQAIQILLEGGGSQWDRSIVNAFVGIVIP